MAARDLTISAGLHWSAFWHPLALLLAGFLSLSLAGSLDPTGRLDLIVGWPIFAILVTRALMVTLMLAFRFAFDEVKAQPGWVLIRRPGAKTRIPIRQIGAIHVRQNPVEQLLGGGTLVIDHAGGRTVVKNVSHQDQILGGITTTIAKANQPTSRAPHAR